MCDVGEVLETGANIGTFGSYGVVKNTIEGKAAFDGDNLGYFDFSSGEDPTDPNAFQGDYLRGRRGEYDAWAAQFTDPERYNELTNEAMQNASTRAANQYATAGLAGSSAAISGSNEAGRKVKMDMMNRQLSDRTAIEQTRLGYTSALQNVDMAQLNAEIGKQNADAQLMSGILTAAGTIGGAALGGPAGGMAGGQAGSMMGPEQQGYGEYFAGPTLGDYSGYNGNPNYGQQGNYWGSNPYSY